jgi:hypothetical protein
VGETLEIAARFCGPPDCANGGYVAGRVAQRLSGPAEVRLRAPTPLERPLELRVRDDGGLELCDGAQVLVTAAPTALELDAPAPPSYTEACARAGSCRAFATHPFPRDFVCGPDRASGDGLRIFPGWFADRELAAAPWVPTPDLADESGRVAPEYVWAALDCASSFPLLEPAEARGLEPMVLARLAVDLRASVKPGEECVVSAWSLGLEGRRGNAGSALWSASGELCALARARWVSLAE